MGTTFTTTHIQNVQNLTKAQFKKAFTDMMKVNGFAAFNDNNLIDINRNLYCYEIKCLGEIYEKIQMAVYGGICCNDARIGRLFGQ